LTINITCSTCDGRNLCDSCRTAARAFVAAGHRVEHSSRYAALRAAAAGAYGFDACVVPVASDERSIVDAAMSLLGDRRLAIVTDDPAHAPIDRSSTVAVLSRVAYESGTFGLDWLSRAPAVESATRSEEPETVAIPRVTSESVDDRRHAARRLKRVADLSRDVIATAGLAASPRLDLLAVLDDEIAWARASDSLFGVCLVHLPGLWTPRNGEAAADAERRIAEASKAVARAVRSSDVISGRGDDFVIVLADAEAAGALLAAKRVAEAIASSALRPKGKPKARSRGFAAWGVGCAGFPKDGTTRESLLARATATLRPI
jgi:predicted signal transduction protein with EAL and GGDEF domain